MNDKSNRMLEPSEKKLWHFVTRNDVAYQPADVEGLQDDDMQEWLQEVEAADAPINIHIEPQQKQSNQPILRTLSAGDVSALDKRSADRFKKGAMNIDIVVDLHGQNRIDAYGALKQAIEACYERNKRLMLVVTGKGYRNDGVLRQLLPNWVNDPILRSFILAFARAKAKDGGDGAFYLLIKRRRT